MEMTKKVFEAILSSALFRNELLEEFDEATQKTLTINQDKNALFEVYSDDLGDIFHTYADWIDSYEVEMSKGVFDVNIRGVPGAYFVEAIEFDNAGYFETLEQARDYVEGNFGEFLVENKKTELPVAVEDIKHFGTFDIRAAIDTEKGCYVLNSDGWVGINCAEFYKPGGSDYFTAWDDREKWMDFYSIKFKE